MDSDLTDVGKSQALAFKKQTNKHKLQMSKDQFKVLQTSG